MKQFRCNIAQRTSVFSFCFVSLFGPPETGIKIKFKNFTLHVFVQSNYNFTLSLMSTVEKYKYWFSMTVCRFDGLNFPLEKSEHVVRFSDWERERRENSHNNIFFSVHPRFSRLFSFIIFVSVLRRRNRAKSSLAKCLSVRERLEKNNQKHVNGV